MILWSGFLVPAEKHLFALHRIILPQYAGEPKRINSQGRMLGPFPGKQTCQGLLDINKTYRSESSWTANCWSWGAVSRENAAPKLPFTLLFPFTAEGHYQRWGTGRSSSLPWLCSHSHPQRICLALWERSLYLSKSGVIQSWSLTVGFFKGNFSSPDWNTY